MIKVTILKNEYLEILEISEEDAIKNAEYIYKNLIVQDEEKQSYIGESMLPVVKIIEWVENPDKTDSYKDYLSEFKKEPDWANDGDFGVRGIMLPYLAPTPEEHKDNTVFYAIVERSGYNDEKGKEALMVSRILHIEDLKSKEK